MSNDDIPMQIAVSPDGMGALTEHAALEGITPEHLASILMSIGLQLLVDEEIFLVNDEATVQ
jgi:hypothetical protein